MKLSTLPNVFLVMIVAGIIFVCLESWFWVDESSFIMRGIAVGLGFFLVYVSVMLSKVSLKTVEKAKK